MPKLNWPRLLLGTLIAAVIMFLTDGFLHERILKTDWVAVYANLGLAPPNEASEHAVPSLVYFFMFELGRAFTALFLYALMRSFFGAGPKTAVLAAIVGWLAFSVAGPAEFIPLGFFSHALWLKAAAFQLITSIVATIAGAASYRELTQDLDGTCSQRALPPIRSKRNARMSAKLGGFFVLSKSRYSQLCGGAVKLDKLIGINQQHNQGTTDFGSTALRLALEACSVCFGRRSYGTRDGRQPRARDSFRIVYLCVGRDHQRVSSCALCWLLLRRYHRGS